MYNEKKSSAEAVAVKQFLENIKNEILNRPVYAAIDVVLFAFLLYALFVFLKKNDAVRLFKYLVLFLAVSVVVTSRTVALPLLSRTFSYAFLIVVIGIAALFPQETRRGLWKISSPRDMQQAFTTQYDCSDEELEAAISDIVRASLNMAKKDVGALIVITPEHIPMHIKESGTKLDAVISCGLLESIFNTKAPLHDGAVLVRGNRIMAAGCFLPLTQSLEVDKELGTRHRAAIGVTETNNVLTIIVSEETGVISVAHRGELKRYYDAEMLGDVLREFYGMKAIAEAPAKRGKRARRADR